MENIFFTSDNHFGHKSILKYSRDTRIGTDVDEMNELMIEKWNSQVKPTDRVYCLGDFSFYKASITESIIKRLNGYIHLIAGNHDNWLNEENTKLFASVSNYKEIKVAGKKVVLMHYPIYEWNLMHYGSYHLFGHVHGNVIIPGRAMDVGIDTRPQKDMSLWSWKEIDEILSQKEIRSHHNKVFD